MPEIDVSAAPLPENVLSLSVSQRSWNGVGLDLAEYRGAGPVLHPLRYREETRLSALLDEVGSPCEPRVRKNRPCPIEHMPRHMHFAPAGLEMWGYSADPRFVRDATLTFDLALVRERLGTATLADVAATPRLRFADDRLWALIRLLSEAVNEPDPSSQLYGDGLTAAIVALLFGQESAPKNGVKRLAPAQLRRVTDYILAHLPNRTEMSELAAVCGLSQSHFGRAFKVSTGLAPYQWQLLARIKRSQVLLLETDASLELVAEATGFADAAHFGRTFRKHIGASPAAWRRDKKG